MSARCYVASVGTAELRFWAPRNDARALRLVQRWCRLFWVRWVEQSAVRGLGRGSVGYAVDSSPSVGAAVYLHSEGLSEGVAGCEIERVGSFLVADVLAAKVRDFYVTVRDAGRHGFLLGPFTTHDEALSNVDRGRKLAENANDRAWFYAYGTASVPKGTAVKVVFPS